LMRGDKITFINHLSNMDLKTNGYLRAAVHAAVTLSLAAGVWFLPQPLTLAGLAFLGVFFLAFETLRVFNGAVNRAFFCFFKPVLRPKEWWDCTGAAYVCWGAVAAVFCFSKDVAIAALCFLAVGDATSSAIGSFLAARSYKSARVFRSFGCFLACLAAAGILHYLKLNITFAILAVGALSAAAFEALPVSVNDNIRIPIGTGIAMTLLLLLW
jgi:dolichol kinase